MSSLLKASSLSLLQVLSCFSLAWSLSHSPDLLVRSLALRIGLEGYCYGVFDHRNGHLRPDRTSARNGHGCLKKGRRTGSRWLSRDFDYHGFPRITDLRNPISMNCHHRS